MRGMGGGGLNSFPNKKKEKEDYLYQIQNNYGIPISFDEVFKVKSSGLIILIPLRHWRKIGD